MTSNEKLAAVREAAYEAACAVPDVFGNDDPVDHLLNMEDWEKRVVNYVVSAGYNPADVLEGCEYVCVECGAYIPYNVRHLGRHPGLCEWCARLEEENDGR